MFVVVRFDPFLLTLVGLGGGIMEWGEEGWNCHFLPLLPRTPASIDSQENNYRIPWVLAIARSVALRSLGCILPQSSLADSLDLLHVLY